MIMKIIRWFLIIAAFITFRSEKVFCEDSFQFNSDYAVYKGSDNKALLEIYYSFYMKSLKYSFEKGEYNAVVIIGIKISDKSGNNVKFDQQYNSSSTVKDTSGQELKKNLIGQLNVSIQDGEYLLEITGTDSKNINHSDTLKYILNIQENISETTMSDVEIASDIRKSGDQQNSFYKNTLLVIPNPPALFGNNLKIIYFYFELYNLSPDSSYTVQKRIYDINRNLIINSDKNIKPGSRSLAEYGTIGIDTLHSGIYFLEVLLENQNGKVFSSKEKKIFVYNLNDNKTNISGNASSQNYLTSGYSQMKEEDLDREFDLSVYIRSDFETKSFKNLSKLEDKRKFMFEFWKARDNNPATPVNEYKMNYFKKINEANKSFKESYREGWKTDRGRIYVTYGKPDDIERFPYQISSKSYEIWNYNSLEGGAKCVFIEKEQSTGIYDLVHSTLRDELRNNDWEKELKN